MGLGSFDVSYELLEQLLCLPDGAKISTVCDVSPSRFVVYVRHPDLEDGKQYYPWHQQELKNEVYVPSFGGWNSEERFKVDAADSRP
jgi:hypothetical protein